MLFKGFCKIRIVLKAAKESRFRYTISVGYTFRRFHTSVSVDIVKEGLVGYLFKNLAQCIQDSVAGYVQTSNKRKIKPCSKDVYIIHYAPKESTAVLVECGFLSNAEDEKLLNSEIWREEFAHSVGSGVMQFLSDLSA